MTSRAIPSPGPAHSRPRNVRLRVEDDEALQRLAAATGQTPGQVIRQLIRIAATGAPDFVGADKMALRSVTRHIAAIGRNLLQLVRAVNRGEQRVPAELRQELTATRDQCLAVRETYLTATGAAVQRRILPLSEAAGLRSPFGIEAEDRPHDRPTGRPRGRSFQPTARDPQRPG